MDDNSKITISSNYIPGPCASQENRSPDGMPRSGTQLVTKVTIPAKAGTSISKIPPAPDFALMSVVKG
jgi:hypothetical protein